MLRVATEANEAMLLEHARLTTAAQLETLTRKYALVQRHGQTTAHRLMRFVATFAGATPPRT